MTRVWDDPAMIPAARPVPGVFRLVQRFAPAGLAALLALAPGAADADPLRIAVTATGSIDLDPPDPNDPGAPDLDLSVTLFIDEPAQAPTGGVPGIAAHYDLGGGAVLRNVSNDDEIFLSSDVLLGMDLLLRPPQPGVAPGYDGFLYVQSLAAPGLTAPIPNVTLPAVLTGLELQFAVPYPGLLPADTTPEWVFLGPLGSELVVSRARLLGEFNPSFLFDAPVDSFEASAVPEPAAALLAAFGLALALARVRRRSR